MVYEIGTVGAKFAIIITGSAHAGDVIFFSVVVAFIGTVDKQLFATFGRSVNRGISSGAGGGAGSIRGGVDWLNDENR